MQALRPALLAHPKLRHLDLSGCALSDDGAGALAALLQSVASRRAQEAWVRGLRAHEAPGAADGAGRGLLSINLAENEVGMW